MASGPYTWAWEIKSVNGKGLDLRLRLPPGWDAIEAPVRARAAEALTRGSIQASLTVDAAGRSRCPGQRGGARCGLGDDEADRAEDRSIAAVARWLAGAQRRDRGQRSEETRGRTAQRRGGGQSPDLPRWSLRSARCAAMRARRSAACSRRDSARSPRWRERAERAPGRQPEAIRARLAEQIATLLDAVRALRSRPAASGGDHDRDQGRRARGARPPGRACRAGAAS